MVLGRFAELFAAGTVKLETDDRHAAVKSGAGVNQMFAGNHRFAADDQSFALGAVDQPGRVAQFAAARVGGGGAAVYQVKRQLGGFAEQSLDPLRILFARQLYGDAVNALTLDRRFVGAGFVNAAADDFNRLVDRFQFQLV